MSSRDFLAWRLDGSPSGDALSEVPERVVEEGPLSIRVNGKPFTVTLRTPGDDRALGLGLLYSEGLVDTPEDLLSLYEDASAVDADAPEGAAVWSAYVKARPAIEAKLSGRSLASTSSCGFCGKTEWDASAWNGETDGATCPPGSPDVFAPETSLLTMAFLETCFRAMRARQDLFGATGGSHAAALFSMDGTLRSFGEDAGRHNAVDKAVGRLWGTSGMFGTTPDAPKMLCVSGRVSYEIASKAARAGITVLAAVSAPSSMAVEFCREHGITLIGFCRGPRATVYAHPERVSATKKVEKAEP